MYTGTRKDASLRMGFQPNTVGGWFDLDRELMFRKSESEKITNKRRTPALIPRQLLAHLKRWKSQGCIWAVEYDGARVGDIKRAFSRATVEANLEGVTPHTLKHTAITWAMQSGAPSWEIAGYFSTSEETINKIYAHHAPDFMESAKEQWKGVQNQLLLRVPETLPLLKNRKSATYLILWNFFGAPERWFIS